VSEATFAEIADALGRRIVADAIWHEGRCNWVAPVALPHGGTTVPGLRSLPPGLYSGGAGVALMLAELWCVTADEAFRTTALAALASALPRVDRLPPAQAIGLYTGSVGVALVSLRCAHLLGAEHLHERGRELLRALPSMDRRLAGHDLISGRAGAVVGLLVAHDMLETDELDGLAQELGLELMVAATRTGDTCSWAHPTTEPLGHLTGLSHGAAGIAHALVELCARTGDERFRDAAQRAIAYERSAHLDGEGARPEAAESAWVPEGGPVPGMHVTWCHGAPGIALARHRAWREWKDADLLDEARDALSRTERWLLAAGRSTREPFCLCHGMAGAGEVLLHCSDLCSDATPAAVSDVALCAFDEFGAEGAQWPCGAAGGGESPDLMLGLAGIARFYMHLAGIRLPSVLLVSPDDVERPSWSARPETRAVTATPHRQRRSNQ
jgi:lantibiotic biosynthesis protein